MSNKHEATFRLKKNNDGRFVGGKDFFDQVDTVFFKKR